MKECKKHYLNDKLWDKFSKCFNNENEREEQKMEFRNAFCYEDLLKLHHYSDKENIISFNEKYSELLLNYESNFTPFFDRLKAKYKTRILLFNSEIPETIIKLHRDLCTSVKSKNLTVYNKVEKFIAISEKGQEIDNITDYLIAYTKDYRIPIAIHIIVFLLKV